MFEQVNTSRKIIHIDMDCFYAAVEIRDNPLLAKKPVAVGGDANKRGVLCTCNYIARKYGVRSAMATKEAIRLCPDLIILPVNFAKYKAISRNIQYIFREFTDLVEPLALDEAYLDVTGSSHLKGSATLIAEEIRKKIWQSEGLTASAGVAPNKLLAKIASGYNKPNGILVIRPEEVDKFIRSLPVDKLFGVGRVTFSKLERLNIKSCYDLQQFTLNQLIQNFGDKFGYNLYNQCRGIDEREVNPSRIRKSISVEETFATDISDFFRLEIEIEKLYTELLIRLKSAKLNLPIKNQYIKVKFSNFKRCTAEISTKTPDLTTYLNLFKQIQIKHGLPIRLIGVGVHFDYKDDKDLSLQLSLGF